MRKNKRGPTQKQLRELACKFLGWGPVEGKVDFYRKPRGWQLGNGTCTAAFNNKRIPEDPFVAYIIIKKHCYGDYYYVQEVYNKKYK